MNLMIRLGQEMNVLPMSFSDMLKLLSICDDMCCLKTLLANHTSPNYIKYAMLSCVQSVLTTQLSSKDQILEATGALEFILFMQDRNIWEAFLERFYQEVSVSKPMEIQYLMKEAIYPMSKVTDFETRKQILTRWIDLPIQKWKVQLRIAFYNDIVSTS